MINFLEELIKNTKKEIDIYENILKDANKFEKEFTFAIIKGKLEGCKLFLKNIEKIKQ